jgi:hypothetical protein
MSGFDFWHKWLLTASFLMIIFGFSLILFNQSQIFNLLCNNQINTVFWGKIPIPDETLLFQKWIYGTLGAVIAGWGVFMTFISTHSFRNKERWSWNCFTCGLLLWFAADTAVSLYFHVATNVLLNIIIFILLGLPLLFTKKYFNQA